MVLGALALVAVSCGTTDKAAEERLPPIRTTTPTTTTTTTTIPENERFYTVKQGDTLGKIAAGFEVPVQAIVDANDLASADAIQAGQTLRIPAGVVLVSDLPGQTPSTAAP